MEQEMNPPARILVVDDEEDLVWAVRHSLLVEGYEVLVAYDGAQGLALARERRPDLIVLDIIMSGMDGLRVCNELRRDPAIASIPILFLSARSAVADRIKGLDQGGDDYLGKPFDLDELRARVRALLRRALPTASSGSEPQERLLAVGDLTLDPRTCQARVRDKRARLTPGEVELLRFLMTHPGEVFSSGQLARLVWDYPREAADSSTVRWHIRNLRAKIEPDPARPAYIRTLPRRGYVLEGPPPEG